MVQQGSNFSPCAVRETMGDELTCKPLRLSPCTVGRKEGNVGLFKALFYFSLLCSAFVSNKFT